MKIKWILVVVMLLVSSMMFAALTHVRQINNFCISNSNNLHLDELAEKSKELVLVSISLVEGFEEDGVWVPPRGVYKSYFVSEFFSCHIKFELPESTEDIIVTNGHSVVEEVYFFGFTIRLL